jgi:hypothetical protein
MGRCERREVVTVILSEAKDLMAIANCVLVEPAMRTFAALRMTTELYWD